MPEINSAIKCSVKDCKHYDISNHCKLNSIDVGGEYVCTDCKETQCKSFKCK